MYRACCLALLSLFPVSAEDVDFVFRSDVSLIRVDAQVVDRNNHAITGLTAEDFLLREEGNIQEIRNFATEDLPVDVLLLLDVSGSMRSHIERITEASNQALQTLGPKDRVGIMVFDRSTRVRLPLRANRSDVERELRSLLQQETFDGGTDITRALFEAARYLGREGRSDARRAIVILTDDQTERGADEAGVLRSLASSNTVMSALIAPDAVGGFGRGGSGWPPSSTGGTLGGIIFGRRGPMGGPIPGSTRGPRMQSAGTANIARQSGGDSSRVDDAGAFENTLARIRQRYALHFLAPQGVRAGEERNLEVELSTAARRRYPGAEIRFRRAYVAPGGTATPVGDSEPAVVSSMPQLKRRPAVNERSSSTGPAPAASPAQAAPTQNGGWRRVDEEKPQGGWRRVKPGEEP